MKYFKYSLLFLLVISLISCNFRNTVKDILPRKSFLKVQKSLFLTVCNPKNKTECVSKNFGAVASGVVVKNTMGGSYALTAGHVCRDDATQRVFKRVTKFKVDFKVADIAGKLYNVEIVSLDRQNDLCLVYVGGLKRPPVHLATTKPTPGDRVYNLAAPVGIFSKDMIPIFEGFYDGDSQGAALYSLPAKGGSSGSPIVNHNGELVGMVSMVFVRFNQICISPRYEPTINFIKKSTERDVTRRERPTFIKRMMYLLHINDKNP
jgi:S1-C subfamily serine protease